MGTLIINDLGEQLIERLLKRAEGNHRSLEEEVREILTAASKQIDAETARRYLEELRARQAGRPQSDSAILIREDRDR